MSFQLLSRHDGHYPLILLWTMARPRSGVTLSSADTCSFRIPQAARWTRAPGWGAERIALAVLAVVFAWIPVKGADDPRRFAVVTLTASRWRRCSSSSPAGSP